MLSSLFLLYVTSLLTAWFYTPIACAIYRSFHKQLLRKHKSTHISNTNDSGIESESRIDTVSESVVTVQATIQIRKHNNKRTQTTNFNLMFATIIILYIISYLPTCAILIYAARTKHFWYTLSFPDVALYNALIRLYIINHVSNPFIYLYFDTVLREKIYLLFCEKRTH